MEKQVLIVASGLALLIMITFSFYSAYRTVRKTPCVCQSKKMLEGEVPLDDICGKYLKLTNLDDTLPSWPAVRNEEETFEEFMDKGSDALIRDHEDLVKNLI
jgi:hypothetical protein